MKLSTPLVLAVASTMVSVGVVAVLVTRAPDPSPAASGPAAPRVVVDRRTPEATAESFLDAWRKREFETSRLLSRGSARRKVDLRWQTDSALSADDRELAKVWDALADTRLALELIEVTARPDGRRALRGVARGTFLDKPYRREVEFILVQEPEGWAVEDMTLGRILTELPAALDLDPAPGRDPSAFTPRGADVP